MVLNRPIWRAAGIAMLGLLAGCSQPPAHGPVVWHQELNKLARTHGTLEDCTVWYHPTCVEAVDTLGDALSKMEADILTHDATGYPRALNVIRTFTANAERFADDCLDYPKPGSDDSISRNAEVRFCMGMSAAVQEVVQRTSSAIEIDER